jgi:L-fuconolactonase
MNIDAHQHFWRFDPQRDTWMDETTMSRIRNDFMPEQLKPLLIQHNIQGCVAVQAEQSEQETSFLLNLAERFSFIKAVVGWVDISAPLLPERLAELKNYPKLAGFRHILQSESPEFMLQSAFVEGLQCLGKWGFTYDLLVFPSHLEACNILLQKIDNQLVVIDHLAKPYLKTKEIDAWEKAIRRLAAYPNVYCKLSGLVTETYWNHWRMDEFEPYLQVVLAAFGPQRLMYGSDWPVCLLAAEYGEQLSIITQFIQQLSADEQAAIMGGTAAHFYQLKV